MNNMNEILANLDQFMANAIEVAGGYDNWEEGLRSSIQVTPDDMLENWQAMLVLDIYTLDNPNYSIGMYFMVQDEWLRRSK